MITSAKNPKIKEIRALQARARARREANVFVLEGVRLAEEALAAGWLPIRCFHTENISERGREILEKFGEHNISIEAVAPHVMKAASDTQTSQGLLLVLPLQTLPIPEALDFVLIIDQVRDPGNLGTLLRSAVAAGAQAVFLSEGSVDTFSPKVLRGAMGAHFRLPIRTQEYQDILSQCESHKLKVLVAAAREGIIYTDEDLTQPLALVVGGEAEGAYPTLLEKADGQIHIPMPGGGESLNAGMAGSILLFEVVRQRSTS
jgi:TrmH family RNA methyltransferase